MTILDLDKLRDVTNPLEEMLRGLASIKCDLPQFDPPQIDLSWSEPGINFAALMPKIDMPKIDIPKFDMGPIAAMLDFKGLEIHNALGEWALPPMHMSSVDPMLFSYRLQPATDLSQLDMPEPTELLVDEEHMYPSGDADMPRKPIGF